MRPRTSQGYGGASCVLLVLACSSPKPAAQGAHEPPPQMQAGQGGASGTNAAGASSDMPNVPLPDASSQLDAMTLPTQDASLGSDAGAPGSTGFARMETLDRGLVAVEVPEGIFISFRMLGPEYVVAHDGHAVSYELLRDGEVIATLSDTTSHVDATGSSGAGGPLPSRYSVRVVIDGAQGALSNEAVAWGDNFLRIPLQVPPSGTTPGSPQCETPNERYTYDANDSSVGDLDGDGDYEIVLKWEPSNAKDNSQSGCTGPVMLDAYTLEGTRLWRIDLGRNIRAGAHYTQLIVYDLDGDGHAEVACKTAPGTRDGTGAFLQLGPASSDDDDADFRSVDNADDRTGFVLTGPEYLSVFDGQSGAERATVAFDQARGSVSAWGDDYGNRVDRFLAGVAYLDDTGLPSFVMARGYYTRSTLSAWTFRDGVLARQWKFDSNDTPEDAMGNPFTGQGAHSLSIANIDADLQQEIIYGAMAIDHDGQGLCSTGYGHGDALHVSDFIPSRPGLEAFMPHEDKVHPAYDIRDAATCAIIAEGPVTGEDTGRGAIADILPSNPGAEMWASGGTPLLSAATGDDVGDAPSAINFLIFWDGDDSRELLDDTSISKLGVGELEQCGECASSNGTKSTPVLSADLLGDFREEVIWREADNSALRLYTTTALATRRIYTLMHDPQYRVAIAWQNVAYNQPPHPSFHIGEGMSEPPVPDIALP